MQRSRWNVLLVAFCLLMPAGLRASGEEGIWKLNVAKSTFPDNAPPPKWRTLKIYPEDGGVRAVVDGEDVRGTPFHARYSLRYDGKKYPLRGNPTADTITARQIDDHTFERTNLKDGKLVVTIKTVISEDGKTRTVYWQGKNKNGEPQTWIEVFEKE
jgi:hypothetical protein